MYKLFYRMALRMYKWACMQKLPFHFNGQVERDLKSLYPGENHQQICADYYVNKLAKSLMLCVAGALLGGVLAIQAKGNLILNEAGELVRGGYGEVAKEVEMECVSEDGIQNFTIEIGSRTYDDESINRLYKSFCAELPEYILGTNASLEEVTDDLKLQESYEGYPFTVEWESTDTDIVHSDGKVERGDEASRQTQLLATISYGQREWEAQIAVTVLPLALSKEERLHKEMEVWLREMEQGTRTEETVKLPDCWQGQELIWKEQVHSYGWLALAGGVIVAVLVYVLADKDLHDSVEKRRQRMKRAYPDVVHKLTLYLGAGMTIRGCFQKMAEEYEATGKEGEKESPVYEEIVHVCRELKAGVSEGAAYEHFGKRTGLQEYIRLSTLLTQNLKKGNSTLLQRLKEETQKASLERIRYGKRLGEEAMTKLLLPMVLMLLVVMLMIMIPAFSTMGT